MLFRSISALDRFYYQALLKGAVARIVELEKASEDLKLSITIERQVGRGGRIARWAFYGIVAVVLFGGGIVLLLKTP